MFFNKISSKRWLTALALSGCFLAGAQPLTLAGSNPGLTIFSGVERENLLNHHLDFGGRPNQWDRYKLYIPAKKLTEGAAKFFISYPEHFDGKFDVEEVEVRVKGDSLPLQEVYWDEEGRVIEIVLENPLEASTKVDLVLSNVKNPDMGTYYFVVDAQAAGEIPLRLYIGTSIIDIDRR